MIALSIGVFALSLWRDDNAVSELGTADAAPMVYVNNTLYIQSSDQQGYPELKDNFIYLGQIVSDVTNSQNATDGRWDTKREFSGK